MVRTTISAIYCNCGSNRSAYDLVVLSFREVRCLGVLVSSRLRQSNLLTHWMFWKSMYVGMSVCMYTCMCVRLHVCIQIICMYVCDTCGPGVKDVRCTQLPGTAVYRGVYWRVTVISWYFETFKTLKIFRFWYKMQKEQYIVYIAVCKRGLGNSYFFSEAAKVTYFAWRKVWADCNL